MRVWLGKVGIWLVGIGFEAFIRIGLKADAKEITVAEASSNKNC
jgi:hypothetical protein